LASPVRKERKGKRRGAAGSAAAAAGRRGRGEERKGERERLTSGAQVSAKAKEKEKEKGRGPARGEGWWAAGPFGPKGKEGKVSFSFSFLFFQTPFKTTFFSNSNQTLSNFFSKIL
jgi:hypothetical protein